MKFLEEVSLNYTLTKLVNKLRSTFRSKTDKISLETDVTGVLPASQVQMNDMTTGINLLRGTRDFTIGKTKVPGSTTQRFIDGFLNINDFTFEKDNDGFTIASKSSNSATSATYFIDAAINAPLINEIEYTFSFDVMIDDLSVVTNNLIARIQILNKSDNTALFTKDINVDKTKLTNGKWSTIVESFKTPALSTNPSNVYMVIRLQLVNKGSIHFRKPMLQYGTIYNPIWAASPFDVPDMSDEFDSLDARIESVEDTLDEINDYTTGINLLRGTRDFRVGSSSIGNFFSDGFESIINPSTIYIDEEGFSVLDIDRLTGSSNYVPYTNLVPVKKGDIVTLSADIVIPESQILGTYYLFVINEYDENVTNSSSRIAYQDVTGKMLGVEKADEWLKVTYTYTVKSDNAKYLNIGVGLYSSSVHRLKKVRKLKLERGHINNPVYSQSPLDVVDRHELTSVDEPMELGLYSLHRKPTITLTQSINLNSAPYNDHGQWGFASTSGAFITDLPEGMATNAAFELSCEYTHATNLREQTIMIPSLGEKYWRYIDGNNAAGKWTKNAATSDITDLAFQKTVGIRLNPTGDEIKTIKLLSYNDLHKRYFINPGSGIFADQTAQMRGSFILQNDQVTDVAYIQQLHYLDEYLGSSDRFSHVPYIMERQFNPKDSTTYPWVRYLTDFHSVPYNNGTYVGQDLTVKFETDIGSTHIATWLQKRVKIGYFTGLNIGDYVNIVCDGVTMRYRIGAIDPYYGCGDSPKGHHIVMVPDEPWVMSAAKDDDYAINTSYLYWNKTADNNGIESEKHPYLNSNLHKWEIEKMLPRFPTEWQNAMMVQRVLLEERFNASSKLTDSHNYTWAEVGKIWSPSEMEVYGSSVWGTKGYSVGVDCQFPIFKQARNRTGRRGTAVCITWYLRTVASGSSANVCCVFNNGSASMVAAAHTTARPLPCFMIG